MTNANYACAIDLLKKIFGKQRKITHAAMQALLKLPAPSNKVSSLRKFNDKMETYIRSLEAMGQWQESCGNLLVSVVLDKMPGEIRKQLARENGYWGIGAVQSTEKSAYWRLVPGTINHKSTISWPRRHFTQERGREREYSKTGDHPTEGKSQERRSSVYFARAGTGPTAAVLLC